MKKHFDRKEVTLISYAAEFGGSALRRIIIADENYYSEYEKPISFPENLEGFPVHSMHFLNFKEQHLACAHTDDIPLSPHNVTEFLEEQKSILDAGNKICLRTHEFEDEDELLNCKFIRLYGHSLNRFKKAPRYKKPNNRFHKTDYIPKSLQKHVLNIEATKLFSPVFDEFLSEYLKIVEYLEIAPKINSTRQFILLWLEKQERFKKTLS
jgi:hypothetical protein